MGEYLYTRIKVNGHGQYHGQYHGQPRKKGKNRGE